LENADLLYEHLASKPKKALYPTISDGTIVQFRNAASSLVLREIHDAFGAAGIPLGSAGDARSFKVSGERVSWTMLPPRTKRDQKVYRGYSSRSPT
jgi:hypothetical protein